MGAHERFMPHLYLVATNSTWITKKLLHVITVDPNILGSLHNLKG
jgi:hypothetical protein